MNLRSTLTSPERKEGLKYSCQSDSTLYFYQQGWRQIMDEGNYGLAAASYRKALSFDPNFLVGKAVLARLTLDLEERLKLFEDLNLKIEQLTGAERKVFEVYLGLVEFTNLQEQKSDQVATKLKEVKALALNNLGAVIHQYPEEIYLKAEYIEFIHSLQGAQASLDSIEQLLLPTQQENPFLLGYTASMYAELGQFTPALEKARSLEKVLNNSELPKSYTVFADVYFQMDSLEKALSYATQAFQLDPRNLDASRLKARIEKQLGKE